RSWRVPGRKPPLPSPLAMPPPFSEVLPLTWLLLTVTEPSRFWTPPPPALGATAGRGDNTGIKGFHHDADVVHPLKAPRGILAGSRGPMSFLVVCQSLPRCGRSGPPGQGAIRCRDT